MINAIIESIFTNDEELFNRVRAYGPGSGINRTSVTVEDATSIAEYGLREAVQDFPDTVSKSDLQTKAQEYLDAHKDPVSDIEISFYYDVDIGLEDVIYNGTAVADDGNTIEYQRFGSPEDISRGDTIRIVSQELGLNTTGVIQEIDWEPGIITLSIGKPQYNLIEVIRGPEEEEERKKAALGLPEPVGLRAQRAEPGCRVFVNPYVNSRAVGVEIYAGDSASFDPSVANLQAKGANTEFDLPQLTSGQVFYFKARSYDNEGRYSDATDAVSAVSGFVQGGRIEGGSIDLSKFTSDTRPIRLVQNLPVVISGDEVYTIGTYVNYLGDLYKLISQTGTPSTDWVPAIDTGSLQDNAVLEAKLSDLSVSLGKIQTDAVNETKIADDSISTPKLKVGAVTANKIETGTITANEIKGRTITAAEIFSGTITANEIKSRTITADEIFAGTITANEVNTGSISTAILVADAIEANMIAADQVRAEHILGGEITAHHIFSKTITADQIADTTITNSLIADGEIRGSKIYGGTITGTNIDNATIDGQNLEQYIIGTREMGNEDIEVSNSSKTAGAFVVRDSGGSEMVRMGDISGKGQPSDYGFWGALGTGVFIEGIPRVVDAGEIVADYSVSTSTSPGSKGHFLWYSNDIASSYTVPSGKIYLILPTVTWKQLLSASDIYLETRLHLDLRDGTTDHGGNTFSAGTYSQPRWYINYSGYNPTSTTNTFFDYRLYISFVTLEYDA